MIQTAMQTRFILPAIFHELGNDAVPLIIEFVSYMEEYILKNQNLSRKSKAAFFGGYFLDQMASIYKDRANESIELEELLDRFLVTLCCSPTCGIVFSDPEWNIGRSTNATIRNKPLLRFISALTPASNQKHQELVLNVLLVAPDIIEDFLTQLSLSFEPRESIKWIENISFLGKIISLPHPPFQSIDIQSLSDNFDIIPPKSVDVLATNIIPSVLSRTILSQGLQHDSDLVKFQTTLILLRIFEKIEIVIVKCKEYSSKSNHKKEWIDFTSTLLQSLKKQLPDIQVVISLHKHISSNFTNNSEDKQQEILYEKTLCLLQYYHSTFTGILSGANFDILKLMTKDFDSLPLSIQIPIISLLDNSSLKWTSMVSGTSLSYIGMLLMTLVTSKGKLKDSLYKLITSLLISLEFFSGTNIESNSEIGAFLNPLTKESVNILDKIIGDCHRRRYELVDTKAKITQELQNYQSLSDQGEREISLLCCSMIRWYYISNSSSQEESIISQYYIASVCFNLLNELVLSPIALSMIFVIISKTIQQNDTDSMEVDTTLNTISLSVKENDVIMSHLLNYIVNLYYNRSIRSGVIQTWNVKIEEPVKSIDKLNNISKSILEFRQQIQQLDINQRIKYIQQARSNFKDLNDNEFYSYFTVDLSLFPWPADFIDVIVVCELSDYSFMVQAHKQFNAKTIYSSFHKMISNKKNMNLHLLAKCFCFQIHHHLAVTVDNILEQSKEQVIFSKSFVNEFLRLLQEIIESSDDYKNIDNTLFHRIFKHEFVHSILLPFYSYDKQNEDLYFKVTNLCISICKKFTSKLIEEHSIWTSILDYYAEKLLSFLNNEEKCSDKLQQSVLHLVRTCYFLCSENNVHALVQTLLLKLQDTNSKEQEEHKSLCYHLLRQQTSINDFSILNKFKSFCKIDLEDLLESHQILDKNQEFSISQESFSNFMNLCIHGDIEAEKILLRILVLLLSPPNPQSYQYVKNFLVIEEYSDISKLYSSWLTDLSKIRASILCLLFFIQSNARITFEQYCKENLSSITKNSQNIINWMNNNYLFLNIIFSVFSLASKDSSYFSNDFIHFVITQLKPILIKQIQYSADIQMKDYTEDIDIFVSRSESLSANLLISFFEIDSDNTIIKENEIAELLKQRKGPYHPNAVKYIDLLMHHLDTNNLESTKLTQSKFVSYCMTSVQTWCSRALNLHPILTTEKVEERIEFVLDTLVHCLDWADKNPNDTRIRSNFISFAKSLLKWNFSSKRVFEVLQLTIKALFSCYEDDDVIERAKMIEVLHDMIVSHSQFIQIILSEDDSNENNLSTRYYLVSLMNYLYSMMPETGYTKELLRIYASAYHATLHPTDQQILRILYQFEEHKVTMVSINYVWGDVQRRLANSQDNTLLSVVGQLVTEGELVQYKKLLQTSLNFFVPSEDPSSDMDENNIKSTKLELWENYDTRFILPFLAQAVELFDLDCRRLIESGIISFAFVSISSKYPKIREYGYIILQRFYTKLKDTRFPEKLQVQVLINLVRNSITKPNQCLSAVIGVFFCKSLIILLHPDHYLYKDLNKYLLRRPVISLDDIPMLYELLYSPSPDNQYQLRNWELDTLSSALHRYRDYKLYKRRNVPGILMGLYDGVSVDSNTRTNILSILKKGCELQRIAIDIVEMDSFIIWLQFHILYSPNEFLLIVKTLLETIQSSYLLNKQHSALGQIYNLLVFYIHRTDSLPDSYYECLELFLKLDTSVDNTMKFSNELLLKLCLITKQNENIWKYNITLNMIMKMCNVSLETNLNEIIECCFDFYWKLANESYKSNDINLPNFIDWIHANSLSQSQLLLNPILKWSKYTSNLIN